MHESIEGDVSPKRIDVEENENFTTYYHRSARGFRINQLG